MSERPILFSGPMVRAILEGRKTQTRRVVADRLLWRVMPPEHESFQLDLRILCPYGATGDRLWVKESIRHLGTYVNGALELDESVYVADGEQTAADAWPWKLKTLPAMFCPKGLSRLTLEVKAVRVERLQEISENDCEAEGIERLTGNGPNFASYLVPGLGHFNFPTMVGAYRELWDGINAKRGHSWETNPWVWVVEFERAEEAR